jgi:hypothetical protein
MTDIPGLDSAMLAHRLLNEAKLVAGSNRRRLLAEARVAMADVRSWLRDQVIEFHRLGGPEELEQRKGDFAEVLENLSGFEEMARCLEAQVSN